MKDTYNLFTHIDEYLTSPKIAASREKHFYPSEASVETVDEHGDKVVYGACLRASYFRLHEDFEGIPYDARAEFIFLQGKYVETMLLDIAKEMGIWYTNNLKFYRPDYNISGEIDAIFKEPDGTLYGVEIKSFYGYQAKKELFGNKWVKGKPKISQLLQTMIYVDTFKKDLPYFRMVYFARDSVDRKTFKIELHEEDGKRWPKVDGEVWKSFSLEDIYSRYEKLQMHLDADIVPPADYELQYSPSKIEDYFAKGKISKTKYEKWKNGKLKSYEHIGDWRCSYCQYKEICYGNK